MTIDTKRLRELAEKATPGPWFAENYATDPYDRTVVYNTFHNGDTMDRDLVAEVAYGNAEFIAATDPQTVLALLDEIERLRGETEWEYYAEARNGNVVGDSRVHVRGAIQAYEEALLDTVLTQEDATPVVFRRRVSPWEPAAEGETND